jgi:2-haloacid dehalogenase
MKYKYIIFDADDTLLNYEQAEVNALEKITRHIGLEGNNKAGEIFKSICNKEWSEFKLDRVDDDIVQSDYHPLYYEYSIERFRKLKSRVPIKYLAEELSELYFNAFSEETGTVTYAYEVCEAISKECEIIVITNGLTRIQLSRLRILKPYIYKIYTSEEIGFIKPSIKCFEHVINDIGITDISKCLMTGDSLVSDIKGAMNIGMDTCWYNPRAKTNVGLIKPTYEIRDLRELLSLSISNMKL